MHGRAAVVPGGTSTDPPTARSRLRDILGPYSPSVLLFAVVTLALLGSGLALATTIAAERNAREQISRAIAVLGTARSIVMLVTGAETGQRGYLLTGDQGYLRPYEASVSALPAALDRLERVAAGTDQRSNVQIVRTLAEEKLSELNTTVGLTRDGHRTEALAIVRSNLGLEQMRELRRAVARLESDEQAILDRAIRRARRGEARALPLLGALAVAILLSLGVGLWMIVRTARAEAQARDVAAVRQANERAELLARELSHRVKNLFAVVASVVALTLRREKDPSIASVKLQSRIQALARAHQASQGKLDAATVDLHELVETTLGPYADYQQFSCEGEVVALPVDSITPLGLILHELATNAVKYGAWSGSGGKVTLRWGSAGRDADRRLRLVWLEEGVSPGEIGAEGFGTSLIDSSARQLGGRIDRIWHMTGLELRLDMPLGPDEPADGGAASTPAG